MGPAPLTAPETASTSVITILGLVLGSSVVAGALGHILTGLRTGATVRRDRYAAAVKVLVARIEYPYKIRRRTSDDPDVLSTLTIAGHDLQETLAESRAWIATESTVLSEVFDNCLTNLDAAFKQACSNAWNATPITAAAEMNLGGFGMGNQQHIVTTMERALAYRFGLRRLIPAFILRRLFRRLQLLRA
ncbi:hypothetical protein GTY78_08020 [Streptomyces sp. SID4934]|uniref:hypothetical protein n=1 Tax=unclassified Streptomyces TaxID=2593676 RepID=UPI0004A97FD6|nr:hypothetical protein [Streptomyces sp. ScaeMP-6W]KDQ66987.1 hypothetical protein DT87_07035 [Streptomyces sp. NTK 937]MYQ70994.1 hypothetical protein [Streptomyces sp. SID4934]SCD64216.1 hypothetical protein GA0115237_103535 [Streptomyces sp. ScaeMP-6W]